MPLHPVPKGNTSSSHFIPTDSPRHGKLSVFSGSSECVHSTLSPGPRRQEQSECLLAESPEILALRDETVLRRVLTPHWNALPFVPAAKSLRRVEAKVTSGNGRAGNLSGHRADTVSKTVLRAVVLAQRQSSRPTHKCRRNSGGRGHDHCERLWQRRCNRQPAERSFKDVKTYNVLLPTGQELNTHSLRNRA